MSKHHVKVDAKLLKNISQATNQHVADIAQNTLAEVDRLILLLNNKPVKLPESIKQSLRNYIIIRLTTMIELVLKNAFIILIDDFGYNFKSEIIVDSEQLKILQKSSTTFTVGNLIGNTLSWTDLDQVNANLKKLMDVDVFKLMRQKESKSYAMKTSLMDMIDERNHVVHDHVDTIIKNPQISKLRDAAFFYPMICLSVITKSRKNQTT